MGQEFLEFPKKQNFNKTPTLRPLADPQKKWGSCRSVFPSVSLGPSSARTQRVSEATHHMGTDQGKGQSSQEGPTSILKRDPVSTGTLPLTQLRGSVVSGLCSQAAWIWVPAPPLGGLWSWIYILNFLCLSFLILTNEEIIVATS